MSTIESRSAWVRTCVLIVVAYVTGELISTFAWVQHWSLWAHMFLNIMIFGLLFLIAHRVLVVRGRVRPGEDV
jgi:hypothetical protein